MIDNILSRLEKVRKSGTGYLACCPSHDDNNPSLHITQADDRILIHCYTGCSALDILSSIDLTLKDLFLDGALEHRLRGATPWIRKQRMESDRRVTNHALVLRMAKAKRERGERLTRQELDDERQAWGALG